MFLFFLCLTLLSYYHQYKGFFLQVRLVCSAAAKPKDLFGAGDISQKNYDDNRNLMDDLGIQEVREMVWRGCVKHCNTCN